MTRLRVRCIKRAPVCNRTRSTLRDTPENRYKLDHGDLICKSCNTGRLVLISRDDELAKRTRCHCDGVQWADLRNSPHDISTPGCIQYEDYKIDVALRSNKSDDYGEPPF